ncbi:MAG: methyltransferase family protein [Fidelibacterota bacterium]
MDKRELLFKYRSYTPVPFILLILILSRTNFVYYILGLIIILSGELLRLVTVGYAGIFTRASTVVAPELVTNGPYAYVRNPLYIANIIIYLGFSVMSWALVPWIFLIVILLFGVQYLLIISLEEDFLIEKFGESYRSYKKAVPRLIPSLRPYFNRSNHTFNLERALKSEKRTFQSISIVSILILIRWLTASV